MENLAGWMLLGAGLGILFWLAVAFYLDQKEKEKKGECRYCGERNCGY